MSGDQGGMSKLLEQNQQLMMSLEEAQNLIATQKSSLVKFKIEASELQQRLDIVEAHKFKVEKENQRLKKQVESLGGSDTGYFGRKGSDNMGENLPSFGEFQKVQKLESELFEKNSEIEKFKHSEFQLYQQLETFEAHRVKI